MNYNSFAYQIYFLFSHIQEIKMFKLNCVVRTQNIENDLFFKLFKQLFSQKEENMKFIRLCESNNSWSLIKKKDGSQGYVPTGYIMVAFHFHIY